MSLNTDRDAYHKEFEREMLQHTEHIALNYENYEIPESFGRDRFASKKNMCSMFYNQLKCAELIAASNIQFDVVIKWRTEVKSDEVFEIVETLQPNTIYIPSDFDYGGVNDQVAYGDQVTFQVYSEVYKNLTKYADSHVYIHPETLLKCHLDHTGVNIVRFRYPYHLQR
ncbi:hypothetical protein EB118_08980 [bacterium]|nr:hypothetical protein [bacterium]NDG30194.1 hypothetical protein [bacterium]